MAIDRRDFLKLALVAAAHPLLPVRGIVSQALAAPGAADAKFLTGKDGTVVGVQASRDGWEVDDPSTIAQSMERLSRLAHRIVWVNPRKAAQGYEPLAGGMAAALPFVDTFVSGHSVRALEDVMAAIRNATDRSPRRVAA